MYEIIEFFLWAQAKIYIIYIYRKKEKKSIINS